MYLAIYAFNNPDAQAYYIASTDETQADLVAIVPDVKADGVTPIHDQFITWFIWMFANQLYTLSWICIIPIFGKCLREFDDFGAFFCSYCSSMLSAYTMGLVWRFGEAGKFASGDELAEDAVAGPLYQVSSGKFISIFYLVTLILMGTMCCCCLTVFCINKIKKG